MGAGLRVLVVDDERPARDDLVRALRSLARVGAVETATAPDAALLALARDAQTDAVFLDVRLPDMKGLALARVLRRFRRPPAIVIVSAFARLATAACEVAAVDFLLEPVSQRRLEQALERVARSAGRPPDVPDDDIVAVRAPDGISTRLLSRASIIYLQAEGAHVRVTAADGRYVLTARLGEVEARWEDRGFARVNRRFVINLDHAVEAHARLNGTAVVVMADGTELPVARRRARRLWERLGG
jgi:DNA-binding LytR/AlgR family response regulator